MKFNAYDQIPAILEAFRDQQVRTFPDAEDEDLVHIAFANPYTGNDDDLEILVTSIFEFIVSFSDEHRHFVVDEWESEEEAYAEMIKLVRSILDNSICSASLYWGTKATDSHWLGSRFIHKEDVDLPVNTVFHYVLSSSEFRIQLRKNGGIVHDVFWNPAFNKQVELGKQTIKQQRA